MMLVDSLRGGDAILKKILVIVPAYNEEKSLPGVLRDLRENAGTADVLVIDDGSSDDTACVAQEMRAKVLRLPYNLGIGGAVQAGYLYAAQHGYDVAIQFDGDGQHCAGEIGKLLRPMVRDAADLVVGSRFLQGGEYKSPIFRKTGIWIFSLLLSRILGMRVTDTTSGFRAANAKVIAYFSRHYPDDYPEVEALVLLHKAGFKITEVPILMQERTGGRSSITAMRSVYYMVKVLLAVFIDLLKK